MTRSLSLGGRQLPGALILGLALAAPLLAHDDDPKILARHLPNNGPGYQAPAFAPAGSQPGAPVNVLAGLGFDALDVQLLSWLPLNQIDNASSGNDCWGYVSPSGREYAIIGTSSGTAFYEVTNPGNPVSAGYVDGNDSLWRDIKTYDHYAYSVTEGGGNIQVIDLANIDNGSVTLVNTISAVSTANSHNVAIDEDSGYLYLCGGGSEGLRIYDLNANPANPSYVASWNTRYVHDAQIVTYTSGPNAGRQLAYCCSGFNGGWNDTGLTILDVTNKANITVASQVYWPGAQYSHQGWLSEDRQYFYMGDELDEDGVLPTTWYVFDVSDPDNAQYLNSVSNGNLAITHNLYTKNGLIYAANYTSGLRVLDQASNPTNPQEIAYFDTYAAGDAATFNGLWSVYPYLPSGVVIGSDLESGLFVWLVGDAPVTVDVPNPPSLVDPVGASVDVTITEAQPGNLNAASAQLMVDTGGGFVGYPLVQVSGSSWRGDFPNLTCGTTFAWYVTAASNGGIVADAPIAGANAPYSSLAAYGTSTLVAYDMETASGWTSGAAGDTATTGLWVRGDPIGTAAQPEDDHGSVGTQCWFTGQGTVGGGVGDQDVDGGTTTLLSPVMDLTALTDPQISYWRWYSNSAGSAPNADVFNVDVSSNGGATWTSVEVVGPTGSGTSGGWFQHSFRVADLVTPTSQVRLRFVASDLGSGSIVEAAVDDLQVYDVDCTPPFLGTRYCSPNVSNSTGLPAVLNVTGSDVVADQDLVLTAVQLPANQFGYFLAGQTQGFTAMPGGAQGNICLQGVIGRFNQQIQNSGATGQMSIVVDMQNIPVTPAVAIQVGETWNFQGWYRDLNPGSTSNFTDGVSVTFQ